MTSHPVPAVHNSIITAQTPGPELAGLDLQGHMSPGYELISNIHHVSAVWIKIIPVLKQASALGPGHRLRKCPSVIKLPKPTE